MIHRTLGMALSVLVFASVLPAQTQEPAAKNTAPLSYGIVVDNSGSYRALLERVINLVRGVANKNSDDDETFLVTFVDASKIVVRQELTSDKHEIVEAAENMFIEGGPSMVLDAVRLSLDYLSANGKSEGRKRTLLLITDGDDRGSSAKIETVINAAKEAKIRIVVVGLTDEKLNTKLLDRLAKESGGTAFYPRTPKDTAAILENVSSAIRGN